MELFQATGQRLGAAKAYSSEFQSDQFPVDGILGMGYESISSFGANSVFQSLVSQNQVSAPVFSFYFSESGSELYIGGTNQNHYTGSFTYMPVTIEVGVRDRVFGSALTINIVGILARLVRRYICQREGRYQWPERYHRHWHHPGHW
jgi:hypothetical protein